MRTARTPLLLLAGLLVVVGLPVTESNRDAVGAVVRLYRGKQVLTRQVHAASGYLAHSSRTLHFGLGDDARIDRVEVTWPRGRRQVLHPVAPNRRHDLVEPGDKP